MSRRLRPRPSSADDADETSMTSSGALASPNPNIDNTEHETATVVGSGDAAGDEDFVLDDAELTVAAGDNHEQQQHAQDTDPDDSSTSSSPGLSIEERIPKTEDVVTAVRTSHTVRETLRDSVHFTDPNSELVKALFCPDFLHDLSDEMTAAIMKCSPRNEKEIPKKAVRFEAKKRHIVYVTMQLIYSVTILTGRGE